MAAPGGFDSGGVGGGHGVPNPITTSNYLSRLLFIWVTPLFRKRGKITEADLFAVTPTDAAGPLCIRLSAAWDAERAAHPLAPSLGRAYFNAFGWDYIGHSAPLALKATFMLLQTVFLGWLLDTFHAPVYSATAAYCYALAMVLCVVGSGLCHHTYFLAAWRCGMQWRSASLALLYAKSTRLRLDALSSVSSGHVVNLAASDVERFQKSGQFFAYLVLAPLEAVAALGLLWAQVGWQGTLAGTAVLLAFVLTQARFSQLFGRLRAATAAITDERVRLTGQVITGIRVLKTLAWEAPFNATVAAVRTREVAEVTRTSYIRGANEGFFTVALVVVAAATFFTFWAVGGVLTPSIVFTSSLLLIILQMEMGKFFPSCIESISEIRVSLRRIQAFLELPELTAVRGLDAAEAAAPAPSPPPPLSGNDGITTACGGASSSGVGSTAGDPPAAALTPASIVVSDLTCRWVPATASSASHGKAATTKSQRAIAVVVADAATDRPRYALSRLFWGSRAGLAYFGSTRRGLPPQPTAGSSLQGGGDGGSGSSSASALSAVRGASFASSAALRRPALSAVTLRVPSGKWRG